MHINFIHPPNIKSLEEVFTVKPKIVTVKEFTDEGFEKFIKDFSEAENSNQDIIPIFIDSYGGEVYILLGMINKIAASNKKVSTILLSKAMSCAAVLFSAGDKGYRFIAPYATLMIHEVSSEMEGKNKEIKADANETERLNTLMFSILDSNCRQDEGYFENLIHDIGHAELYLTAKEAIKHGIADKIGVPNLNIELKLSYKLKC